ncbi:Outer spore wall protein 2 [Hanseniaspora uvarum DSM 2768]|nr:Outer spore wall protein 2 [Hanseniaspora uvarum DSM 2768]
MSQSACIFYGDTPVCIFASWRISYTNISVINISSKISSDGIISWKSDKLGSNFYTPNLFIKDIFNNSNSIQSILNNDFKINYIFLSCDSIFELNNVCDCLNEIISNETVIFVESNFAVDLDLHVYKHYQTKFHKNVVVFSVLSDLEGRKLTSGSYILLSENINFYFGLSYVQNANSFSDDFSIYLNIMNKQFSKADSRFHLFIDAMNATKEAIIFLHKISLQSNELAIRIWNNIIPKIIFNIISIIYEDTDYIHFMDENKSLARDLSENTLKEMTKIAYAQCNNDFELINPSKGKANLLNVDQQFLPFVSSYKELETSNMNYDHLVDLILQSHKKLNAEKHNKDSPEYVTFSFEAYCFYHKIEYPASIMFSQIFALSKKYSLESMCLKFLSQFYERLCILSGMPFYLSDNDKKINGLETNANLKKQSLIFGRSNITLTGNLSVSENNHGKLKRKVKEKRKLKAKKKSSSIENELKSGEKLNSADYLVDDIAALYLDALDTVDILQSSAPLVHKADVTGNDSDYYVYAYTTASTSSLSKDSDSKNFFSNSESDSDSSYGIIASAKSQNHDSNDSKKLDRSKFEQLKKKRYEIPKKAGTYESLISLKEYFDKSKKSFDKNPSNILKIMTVDVEYEMMKRLSHNYEVEDKSRYSGIYLNNEMLKNMNSQMSFNSVGSDVAISLQKKRKELMQDIGRFRRYKIEHSMKKDQMELMRIMEEKLNDGLKQSSTNRFSYTDSITKINKKHLEGKTQNLIEYKKEEGEEELKQK